jgi:hypothetical protein
VPHHEPARGRHHRVPCASAQRSDAVTALTPSPFQGEGRGEGGAACVQAPLTLALSPEGRGKRLL